MANLRMMQQQADLYNEQLGKYGQAAQQYNLASDVYNRQVKEYQALVDAYNANPEVIRYNEAVKNYNEVLTPQYNQAAADYNKKLDFWNNGTIAFGFPLIGMRQTTPAKAYEAVMHRANTTQGAADREYQLRRANDLYNTYIGGPAPSAPTQPTQPNVQRPGDFTAKKPEMSMEMPKDPGFTGQQMEQLMGKQSAAKQEMAGQQEIGLVERAMTGKKQKPDSLIGGILQNVRYST